MQDAMDFDKFITCNQESCPEYGFVFGSEDPSVNLAGLLHLHERENMTVRILPGQDHYLSRDNFDLTDLVAKELLR